MGRNAEQLQVDYEEVLALAEADLGIDVALSWMDSRNGHLGGAKPKDALSWGRREEVLEALEAQRTGSYA